MKILYLSQTFPPEPGATIRPFEQAVTLARRGHDVRVLTAFPSYPTGILAATDRGRLFRRECRDGIEVLRLWSTPAASGVGAARIVSWTSFAFSTFLAGMFGDRPDIVIASVPNIGTDVAGLAIARARRAKFVLELRDLLPQSVLLTGMASSSAIFRLTKRIYAALYRRCDLIAVPFEAMIGALASGAGVETDRLLLMPHGVDADRFAHADGTGLRRSLGLVEKKIAMYAGSFSPHYDVPSLVDAAAELERHSDMHMVLIGDGVERNRVVQLARGRPNMTIAPAVAPNEIASWLDMADLFIAPIRYLPECEYRPDRTTKVCDYQSFGRPCLVVEDAPCIGPFIERIGAGTAVPWGRAKELAHAIEKVLLDADLQRQYGDAARRFAESELGRDATMSAFFTWLDGLDPE